MKRWMQGLVGLGLALAVGGSEAPAAVQRLIRYQGKATDASGVPLEGNHRLVFRLYDAATGGTKKWEEVWDPVAVSKGYFSVVLGQSTPLDTVDWSQPLWVAILVNSSTTELSPRQALTAVPYAIRAEAAEGLTGTLAPSKITPQGSGSGLDADTVDGKHAVDLIPSGLIGMFDAACPSGWTRYAALDGRVPRGASSAGATGGADTHTHAVSGTTGNESDNRYLVADAGGPSDRICGGDGSCPVTRISHTHAFSATSQAGNSWPPYLQVVWCKKN